uniref:Ig-like domain-containing protein n=1 Tax=Terrapene triunguis TaxID=2587831 RepID=A0A674JUU2_9SAUR
MGTPCRVWLTLLLFYKAGSSRAKAGAMELSRILGDNVTFPLGIPAEQLITVAWTVNTTRSIVTVAAGNPPNVIVTDLSYKGRLRVPENYSLQITNLRMEDTGTYRAQITTATGTIPRPFLLRVYKQVPEPTVVCDSGPCVNETCNYNLRCTVRDGGDNVTYSWTHTAGGTVVPDESILHISLSPRDAHLAVTCTAQNPASNSSTTASAKDLCAAPPHGSQSAIIAGILGFFLVILFVIIALWLVRTHKRKRALQKYTPGPAGSAGKSLLCPTDLLACTSPPKCIVLPKSDFQPLSRLGQTRTLILRPEGTLRSCAITVASCSPRYEALGKTSPRRRSLSRGESEPVWAGTPYQ